MGQFIVKNIPAGDFNLDHIFDCGQCFRWDKQDDGSYTGVAMGRVVNMKVIEGCTCCQSPATEISDQMAAIFENLKPKGNYGNITLLIDNCNEEDFLNIWKPYLDLNRDYGKIKSILSEEDYIIRKAINYGYGIRILNQDLWETMVSFIISQNNNIPRIKGCIENLASNFGTSAGIYKGKEYFNLPTPSVLAKLSIEDLGPVKLGYRARYLIETAKSVCANGLPSNMEELSSLCGVGPKVANCIGLFGMSKYDSFPIDVWVRRVMQTLYGIDEKDIKAMETYATENFGNYGGFAQQYLFYYIRSL